jgi:hypothetical protein
MILITSTIARLASLLGDRRNDHRSGTTWVKQIHETDQAVNEG